MNSKERHEIRYQRRVAARQAKRTAYSESFGRYEDVFSYEHLYQAGKNCCKGVMWKNSTQSYMSRITTNTASTHDALLRREFRSRGFHDFDLIERGKLRHMPLSSLRAQTQVQILTLVSFSYFFLSDSVVAKSSIISYNLVIPLQIGIAFSAM